MLLLQPCHLEAVEFVAARRRETCDDTEHMLRVLGHVTDDTPAPLVYWLGWLLNSGRLVTMGLDEIDQQDDAPQLEVRGGDAGGGGGGPTGRMAKDRSLGELPW